MKLTLDRTLRWIWLLIGAAVLLLLLIGGFMVAAQMIGNAGAREDAARVVKEARPPAEEVRPVRYGLPRPIPGTDTRIVLVGGGDGYARGFRGYDGSSGSEDGPHVNAVFLDAQGARLLVDRPASIHHVWLPGQGPARADSTAPWITYLMAVEDGDGNGRVDDRDPPGLFVTDRDGRSLRTVLRPPLRYESHQALDAARILVDALEAPAGTRMNEKRMPQRAFIYDVASGQLSPHAALDSAAAHAARILGR